MKRIILVIAIAALMSQAQPVAASRRVTHTRLTTHTVRPPRQIIKIPACNSGYINTTAGPWCPVYFGRE